MARKIEKKEEEKKEVKLTEAQLEHIRKMEEAEK